MNNVRIYIFLSNIISVILPGQFLKPTESLQRTATTQTTVNPQQQSGVNVGITRQPTVRNENKLNLYDEFMRGEVMKLKCADCAFKGEYDRSPRVS